MNKPDDIEQWALDEADELMRGVYVTSEWFPEDITVEKSRRILQGKIARALIAVKAEQREEDAKIASIANCVPFSDAEFSLPRLLCFRTEVVEAIRKGDKR